MTDQTKGSSCSGESITSLKHGARGYDCTDRTMLLTSSMKVEVACYSVMTLRDTVRLTGYKIITAETASDPGLSVKQTYT